MSVNAIPRVVKILMGFFIPIGFIFLHQIIVQRENSMRENIAMTILGIATAFILISILKNPKQFWQAIKERCIYLYGKVVIMVLQIANIFRAISKMAIKFIIYLIYLFSPLDLLPEIPLGPIGLIDDALFTFYIIWGINQALKHELREKIRSVKANIKINTPFP